MAPTDGSRDEESPNGRPQAQLYEEIDRLRKDKDQRIKDIKDRFQVARRDLEVNEEAALGDIEYEYQRKSRAAVARYPLSLVPAPPPHPVAAVSLVLSLHLDSFETRD